MTWLDTVVPPAKLTGDRAVEAAEWRVAPPDSYCPRCGVTVAPEAVTRTGCGNCRMYHVAWDRVWKLGDYEPPLREWILEMKYQGLWPWAEWMGKRLARVTPDAPGSIVTPVPMHFWRRFTRRYNQAELIARAFARAKGLRVAERLRRRRWMWGVSVGSTRTERLGRVRRAFLPVTRRLDGTTVWLVDDVKTTGATAERCARLLKRAGAERVNLLLVAVTPLGDVGSGGGLGRRNRKKRTMPRVI